MRIASVFAYTIVVLAAASVALPSVALAQGSPSRAEKADATRMKREADALMDQDKYADAQALYVKAYEISGDPALLYNQGRALEAMGEYWDALQKLEQFERDAPPALRAKVPGLHDLLTDLRGRISTLVITTNAPGARVFVRERAVTPDSEHRVHTRAGPASVEVVADGFESFHKNVELPPGGTLTVEALLTAKKGEPLLIVRTRPTADITLGTKALGRSPLEARVAPGSYVLVAHAEGHDDERVGVTLALGDRREVDLELKRPPSIFSRWWFWTGIGVVVAGAVTTVVLVTTERSPSEGTFKPGSVVAP